MIVTIKSNQYQASIDSLGAQLISLKGPGGQEYIWQRNPDIWSSCSPILFPVVGNCRNNKIVIEGSVYEIPKHGFARNMDFTMIHESESQVTFELRNSEYTKQFYPYAFCLSLTYTLKEHVLSMDYQVHNTDRQTIHYCLGAHPGFICPMADGESFTDYALEFEQEETADCIVYDQKNLQFDPSRLIRRLDHSKTLPLSYELFQDDAIYFKRLHSKKVSLLNPSTQKGVEVSFPDFAAVAFWTPVPANAPFLCIEPWNGSAVHATEDDELIHKNDIQSLEIGEHKNYHLGIRIL